MFYSVDTNSLNPWNQPDPYWNDYSINNAWAIYYDLKDYDPNITDEAIAGIVGNILYESYANPEQSEQGGNGYGLIQWTPKSDLSDYVSDDTSGDEQVDLIYEEIIGYISGRWLPTYSYPYTGLQYFTLTDVDVATNAYLAERLRGTYASKRFELAHAILSEYQGGQPPTPPSPPEQDEDILPILMLCKLL